MSKIEKFLSADDEAEIIEAIRLAEKATSGEIRIHIESTSAADAMHHATEVFQKLEMDKTQARNGVLIYIAVESKVFVILGDKGINDVVPENFWNSTKELMQEHFKKGEFRSGIVAGIEKAGEQLQKYFLWTEGDKNELSDEISKS